MLPERITLPFEMHSILTLSFWTQAFLFTILFLFVLNADFQSPDLLFNSYWVMFFHSQICYHFFLTFNLIILVFQLQKTLLTSPSNAFLSNLITRVGVGDIAWR